MDKDKVNISEAILKKSKILILDEATSAVDKETDDLIQKSLKKLIKKKITIIFISHRLSSILFANRLIVLKDGKLIFEGIPSEYKKKIQNFKNVLFALNYFN